MDEREPVRAKTNVALRAEKIILLNQLGSNSRSNIRVIAVRHNFRGRVIFPNEDKMNVINVVYRMQLQLHYR